MRGRLDKKLKRLHSELILMSALCEDAIACAIKALFENNMEMVEKTEQIEKEVDKKEAELEKLCINLLLHEQPVAGDLRMIAVAQRMIVDMERISDQANDIAEIAKHCAKSGVPKEIPLKEMATLSIRMLNMSIDSFVNKDLQLAYDTIAVDNQIDRLFDQTKKSLVLQLKSGEVEEAVLLDMLMIAKYLERIGDHSENIAQQTIYSITGETP